MPPGLVYHHLRRLTTPLGLFEHALGTEPRIEHGFCVDDVARALVVTSRDRRPHAAVPALAEGYLDFVLGALDPDGRMHNRRTAQGHWADTPSTDDHWGRGVWALGVASVSGMDAGCTARAEAGLRSALRARSRWPRAMSYAALGAFAACGPLAADPFGPLAREARALIADTRALLATGRTTGRTTTASTTERTPGRTPDWPWPEPRLTYANAVLPEALMVIGQTLGDDEALDEGLTLLAWLTELQHHDGHLSVVPAGGWSPGGHPPAYPQQPIEVAALAEASARAYEITGSRRWLAAIDQCRAWFSGANDLGLPVMDPATGGGYDGLERDSVNANQGAESTLAWLATHQISLLARVEAHA